MTAGATATPVVPPTGEIDELLAIDRPTQRDEAWRYAPHRDLAQLTFGPSPSTPPELPSPRSQHRSRSSAARAS